MVQETAYVNDQSLVLQYGLVGDPIDGVHQNAGPVSQGSAPSGKQEYTPPDPELPFGGII